MNDWQPFSDAVEDVTGGNTKIQLKDYTETGAIPVIDQGKRFIGGYTSDRNSVYSGPLPCVIFGDHTKILKYVDFPFALGADGVKVLAPRSAQLGAKFLYYYLRSQNLPNAGYSRHFKFLKDIQVPLPSLDEQRRAVGLLDRATEIMRRAEAARTKARVIVPALFLDMFGDPATNPKGWPVQALAELGEIGSGLTKGRKLNGTPAVPTPYLRVANVQADRLDLSEIKLIDATDDDRLRCRLEIGDLLMTEGGDIDKLGRCAMWRGEIDLCLHQNHVFRVRMGTSVHPVYAQAFMQCEAARSYFLRVAKRTTGIASINKSQLGQLPVWVAPLPLQTAFAEQARRVGVTVCALDAAAAKAETLAKSLLAQVFERCQH